MWVRWTDTSRVSFGSRTLYTTGDNCEQTTYELRHSRSSFGLGPSESWYGLYTSNSCPGWNTGYDLSCYFRLVCLHARSGFWHASSKAICHYPACFVRVLRYLLLFLRDECRELYRLVVEVVSRTSRKMVSHHASLR